MKLHRSRGFTLLETLIAMGISSVVFGVVLSVYGLSTRSYYRDVSQTYVQNRVRVELDEVSKDIRGAKALLRKAVLPSGAVINAQSGQTAGVPACLILLVPSQDANGLFSFGPTDASGSSYPGAGGLVNDLIIYRHAGGSELRRTVVPNVYVTAAFVVIQYTQVKTTDGAMRSSYRAAQADALMGQDMATFRLHFRDKDGAIIPTPSVKGASVDVTVKVASAAETTISMTGVRLRNMRSASIYGLVEPATADVKVEAIIISPYGAYPVGTIVGSCLTTDQGAYEVFGLVGAKYRLRFTLPNGYVTLSSDLGMEVEDEKPFNAGTHVVNVS